MTDDDWVLVRSALKVYRAICSQRIMDAKTQRERDAWAIERGRADDLLARLAGG